MEAKQSTPQRISMFIDSTRCNSYFLSLKFVSYFLTGTIKISHSDLIHEAYFNLLYFGNSVRKTSKHIVLEILNTRIVIKLQEKII